MQIEQLFPFQKNHTNPISLSTTTTPHFGKLKQKGFEIQLPPAITQGLHEASRLPSLISSHTLEGPLTSSNSKHLLNIYCLPGIVLTTLYRYTDRHCNSTAWVRKEFHEPVHVTYVNGFT